MRNGNTSPDERFPIIIRSYHLTRYIWDNDWIVLISRSIRQDWTHSYKEQLKVRVNRDVPGLVFWSLDSYNHLTVKLICNNYEELRSHEKAAHDEGRSVQFSSAYLCEKLCIRLITASLLLIFLQHCVLKLYPERCFCNDLILECMNSTRLILQMRSRK